MNIEDCKPHELYFIKYKSDNEFLVEFREIDNGKIKYYKHAILGGTGPLLITNLTDPNKFVGFVNNVVFVRKATTKERHRFYGEKSLKFKIHKHQLKLKFTL